MVFLVYDSDMNTQSTSGDADARSPKKILRRTVFGNPILRQVARRLTNEEILSPEIQQLIADIRYTVEYKVYGVGLAAPQVGVGVALTVIGIKSTPNRPNLERFETVLINPEIVATFGRRTPMWEGCISCGTGADTLYAKVPRYKEIRLRWQDEQGKQHDKILSGFVAHVAQHEVDHLEGIVFTDRVRDRGSFMMASEYKKRIVRTGSAERVRSVMREAH